MESFIAKHFASGEAYKIDIEKQHITGIEKVNIETDLWMAPGFMDIQLNGYAGYDFNDMNIEVSHIVEIVKLQAKFGVTKILPTIVTGTDEKIEACISTIVKACKEHELVRNAIIGIHIEGPFISELDGPRGAHNKDWVKDADISLMEKWIKLSEGLIKKVTLAPEKANAIALIEYLKQHDIVASIGHSNATIEDINKAVAAGATMCTHLGNGSHAILPRHPNYIWDQLANDELWASFIADGFHLPTTTLKVMLRAKGDKAILTSDAVNLAGMKPGRYQTAINSDVTLEENGFLHVTGTTTVLAGAALPLLSCMNNVLKWELVSLKECIEMVSTRPAQMLGSSEDYGHITKHKLADLCLFHYDSNHTIEIVKTISHGNVIYNNSK